jgi:hypothetical protein
MDDFNETIETTDSFGKELAKTAALSVASTAGTFGGLVLVGLVIEKVRTRRARKAAEETASPEAE